MAVFFVHAMIENTVVGFVDPNVFFDVADAYRRGHRTNVKTEFLEFTESLDINDPPVLVKYHLKD